MASIKQIRVGFDNFSYIIYCQKSRRAAFVDPGFDSTDAIKFAVENNIDIVFLDFYGTPYGRVWHSKLGSTTLIRRRQLEISDKDKGLVFVKKWGKIKIDNQIELLKKFKLTRPNKKEEIEKYINKILGYKEKLDN